MDFKIDHYVGVGYQFIWSDNLVNDMECCESLQCKARYASGSAVLLFILLLGLDVFLFVASTCWAVVTQANWSVEAYLFLSLSLVSGLLLSFFLHLVVLAFCFVRFSLQTMVTLIFSHALSITLVLGPEHLGLRNIGALGLVLVPMATLYLLFLAVAQRDAEIALENIEQRKIS